jgi:hypothetical protein
MFRLLSEGKLRPYLRRTLAADSLLVFLHIPKTAGSSLTTELNRRFAPYLNLAPDYGDGSRPFQDREQEMLARLARLAGEGRLRSASGHYTLRRIRAALRGIARPAYVSMVREPVTRVVSDYQYMTSPAHPDHRAAKERFPTLEDYVGHPHAREKMARFLLADPAMAEDAIPEFLDRSYAFLGTVEAYEMSSFLLMALGGHRAVSTARVRVAAGGPTRLDALDPVLVSRIAELNPRDGAIWRHVNGVLERLRPAYERLRAAEG